MLTCIQQTSKMALVCATHDFHLLFSASPNSTFLDMLFSIGRRTVEAKAKCAYLYWIVWSWRLVNWGECYRCWHFLLRQLPQVDDYLFSVKGHTWSQPTLFPTYSELLSWSKKIVYVIRLWKWKCAIPCRMKGQEEGLECLHSPRTVHLSLMILLLTINLPCSAFLSLHIQKFDQIQLLVVYVFPSNCASRLVIWQL